MSCCKVWTHAWPVPCSFSPSATPALPASSVICLLSHRLLGAGKAGVARAHSTQGTSPGGAIGYLCGILSLLAPALSLLWVAPGLAAADSNPHTLPLISHEFAFRSFGRTEGRLCAGCLAPSPSPQTSTPNTAVLLVFSCEEAGLAASPRWQSSLPARPLPREPAPVGKHPEGGSERPTGQLWHETG